MMTIPTGGLPAIRSEINTVLDACKQAGTLPDMPSEDASEQPTLAQALEQLVDVMARVEADTPSAGNSSGSITEIGEYALQLHEALTAAANKHALSGQQQPLASLAINIALWIARHGGHIDSLEPVVDALAYLANHIREPAELAKLSAVIDDVIVAVPSLISQDLEKMNSGRPWRLLLLNNSIVATRSHDTGLMEAAFALMARKLPEDAGRFFSEGMEQMDALDYPPRVRQVMAKYHREWPVNRSLH